MPDHRSSLRVPTVALVAVAVLVLGHHPAWLGAQSAADSAKKTSSGGGAARKEVIASRMEESERAPRIDGRLDDRAWQRVAFISDFRQRDPDEGAEPTERTEVGFLFDDEALYVGARMHSAQPREIRALMTRRDRAGSSEQLVVSLDTYLDRRTAYGFGLTAAGVRLDHYHPRDEMDERDNSFDPVWEGRVWIDSAGWTAEMRIPFSQLRFNEGIGQRWGLNVRRRTPARNEDVFWVLVPKDETGWSSRFGDIVGIRGIKPSRRAEVVPYVASRASFVGDREAGDPFGGSDLTARIGGDLKMGLGPSLTLDATVNPDFGQVEADPADVNLSAFETFFSERRPFFTEGRRLFEGLGAAYFYSRRIGAEPRGRASGDYVDRPENTTILGAAKVTGRLPSGLSIGALAALTDREYASTFVAETDAFSRVRVEPRTGFAVVRAEQEFGASGSTAGLIFTGVRRGLTRGDALGAIFNRGAYSGGGDLNLRFKDGAYRVSAYAGVSAIEGDSAAILRVQRSSARYFQRPDARYVTLDSGLTSLAGYTGSIYLLKEGGRHWLWQLGGLVTSPTFELNDAGRLSTADDITSTGGLWYRETKRGDYFREYIVGVSGYSGWNFGGVRQALAPRFLADATWRNYWSTSFELAYFTRALSDDLTRGGPLMGTGARWEVSADLSGNPARTTRWDIEADYERDELGGWSYSADVELSIRPRERWEFSVQPGYTHSTDSRQYITSRSRGPAATYGRRYIFSFVEDSELSAQVRLNYLFSPTLNLGMYAEPFAASGRFFDYGELVAAGSRDLRFYGAGGTTLAPAPDGGLEVRDGSDRFILGPDDFNVRSFRSNLVLHWEWRPGSAVYLLWQQDLSSETTAGRLVRPSGLWESLSAPGNNFFAIKVSYWLPI